MAKNYTINTHEQPSLVSLGGCDFFIDPDVVFEGLFEIRIDKPRIPYPKSTHIGRGTWVQSGAIIYPGVTIGDNCLIGYNTVIRENTIIGNNTTIGAHSQVEGNIVIGKNCSIWTHAHLTAFMSIGDNVFIAPRFTALNDPVMSYKRPYMQKRRIIKGPTIEDNVRISGNVVVQPGIVIGEEALIGTSALVTKDVGKAEIVYGVPAKIMGIVPICNTFGYKEGSDGGASEKEHS